MSLLSRIAVLSVLLFAFNTYAADDLKRPVCFAGSSVPSEQF